MGFCLPVSKGKLFLTTAWILAISSVCAFAQIIQSNGSGGGNWNSPTTWVGGVVPNSANSSRILIMPGDNVTVPGGFSVAIDQTNIRENATLTVAPDATLAVVEGSGNDLVIINNGSSVGRLIVFGTLHFSHGVTAIEHGAIYSSVLTNATTSIEDGGRYVHNFVYFGAKLPTPEWKDGSTAEVRGLTSSSSVPANLNQSFYNFVWNCPNQQKALNMAGNLSNVRGNLEIVATGGSSKLYFMGSVSGRTMQIGGNLIFSGSGSAVVSNGNNTLNVAGSIINTSSQISTLTDVNTLTVNVGNGLFVNSGHLRLARSGVCIVNLTGNFVPTGLVSVLSGGRANINFIGNTTLGGSNTSGYIFYNVPSGSVFDFGTNYLAGTGGFTLQNGATALIGAYNGAGANAAGALQSNTTSGNLRVRVAGRVFQPGSTLIYNAVTPQQIGSGQPDGVNLIIDNPSTVSVLKNFIAAQVTLQQGVLATGDYNITLTGDWIVNSGSLNAGTGPLIFGGISSLLGPGAKSFGSVIAQTGSLVNLPNENISISGNLSIASTATFETNQSNVVLNGGGQQNISADSTVFNNITVNKMGGAVSLVSPLLLAGRLEIPSATTVNSNGWLTVLSSNDRPATDGAIGPLSGGAAVAGNVTVQRYMSAVGIAWRHISSPVQNTPLTDLADDFRLAGNSLRYYDPTIINVPKGKRFRTVWANSNSTLNTGRGYAAYMYENRVVQLDFNGAINSGTINLPVAFGISSPPMPDGDGWNLVGNPYPSSIVWNAGPGWNRTNMTPTIGIEVSGSGGQFHYHNYNDNSGDASDGVIAIGQGFWVFSTGPNPVLQINEQAKTGVQGGSFYRERPPEFSKQLVVALTGSQGTRKTFLKLHSEATQEFDYDFDAYPLPLEILSDMNITLVDRNGADLLMHTVDVLEENDEIPLHVFVPKEGEYSIAFKDDGQFALSSALYLHDRYNGIATQVSAGNPYTFATTESGGITNRFYLSMDPGREQALSDIISVYPNPFTSQLVIEVLDPGPASAEIIDVAGKRLSMQEFINRAEIDTEAYVPGFYFAKIRTNEGVFIRKVLKR